MEVRDSFPSLPRRILIVYSSYKSLSPKTRGLIGLGLMANASIMLLFSDQIEEAIGLAPAPNEKTQLFKAYAIDSEKKK